MRLNKMIINDVSTFSDLAEACNALIGKYGKDFNHNYQMTMIKNVCFVNTTGDCTIQLPDHYKFAYCDGVNGTDRHIVDETVNEISITGITSFFFHMKNS